FHVIGQVMDRVWREGNPHNELKNVQTLSIAPGDADIVQFKTTVPGTYILVDHSLTRAFNRGALAQLQVTGEENKQIYSGKILDEVYLPEGTGIRVAEQTQQVEPPATTKAEQIKRGQTVFRTNCIACHQLTGQGIPGAFPPLAQSDFLNKDKIRAIKTVTGGRHGKLVVNGHEFDGVMPAWSLPDDQIANVLTYVYNSWGNS